MSKYLLVLLCSIVLLFVAFFIHLGIGDDFSEWMLFFSFICIPILIFGIVSIVMGHALRRANDDGKLIFPRSSLNLQIILSAIYICVISYWLFVPHRNKEDTIASDDCTASNLQLLATADSSLEKKYLMAYDSLKHIVKSKVKNGTDTAICLNGVFSKPFDTVINGHKMTTKIILALILQSRDSITFRYLFCCNDSIGFTVNRYPLAKL